LLARAWQYGTLDGGFGGGDGKFAFTFGGVDIANAVAIQTDGKIVVTGFTDQGGAPDNVAVDTVDPMSGDLTLREMINLANAMDGPQTITFKLTGHNQIDLNGTELSITDDLTIRGPGAHKLAVSGNDASRVFSIGPDAAVTISGLTITHGLAVNGGGILNAGGTLTLSRDVISDNQARGTLGQILSHSSHPSSQRG
jgi:hypothetical protein